MSDRVFLALLTVCALVVGLGFAMIGVYGVLEYRRAHEAPTCSCSP